MQTRAGKTRSEFYTQNRSHSNYDTPKKVKFQTEIEGFNRRGPTDTTSTKSSIYRRLDIPYGSSFRLQNAQNVRRVGSVPEHPETRGRKSKLTAKNLKDVEELICNYGHTGRRLNWEELAHKANLDCSGQTLQRYMRSRNYRRYIACRATWVSPEHAIKRLDFATEMLQKYSYQYHWRRVRFSDKVHFGYGPEGKVYVTRKPRERYCMNCTQIKETSEEKNKERGHAWAVVGHTFKSDLIWYNLGNKNGKMQAIYYRNMILDKIVWPWIDRDDDFVLEED